MLNLCHRNRPEVRISNMTIWIALGFFDFSTSKQEKVSLRAKVLIFDLR